MIRSPASAVARRKLVFGQVAITLPERFAHVDHAAVEFDDHGRNRFRRRRDDRGDIHFAGAERHQPELAVEEAVDHGEFAVIVLECAVLEVERHHARRKAPDHGGRIVGPEIARPEGIDLELDRGCEFSVNIVFEPTVEHDEFKVVVVLKKGDAVPRQFGPGGIDPVGGAPDGVEVLEIVGPESADRELQIKLAEDIDHLGQVVAARPRRMRGTELEAEIVDDPLEFPGLEAPESGGFDRLIADAGNEFQHVDEVFGCIVPQRIELNADVPNHFPIDLSCFLVKH
ncbi:hypothetical protein SDC9_72667 [bioreactor metagenome]|uniref:Uncharacterized protein n=1 Tax=bioreactor metagenome TaxID=1076179 RepID=A0A644YC76_9ZZZZ